MHTFLDTEGRTWKININVAAISEVRAALDIDLLKVIEKDGELIERLVDDLPLLCQVIFVLCDAQAKEDKVSPEDFARAMGGDSLENAMKAFLEELADFFPSQRRQVMHLMIQKGAVLQEKVCALALAELEALDLDKEASTLMKSGDSSGSSPESQESTPGP